MTDKLKDAALYYHENPKPGKLEITATKPLANQRDLALAYSPGVAAACEAIHEDPANAAKYTARGNLVAVITNGTAVLGLGAIGPLASKPVMEGKAVLFKKFAGIDVFDLEVQADTADEMINVVKSLEPTFGGVNLEDIKAPECFLVERALQEKMKIPVFHDDQHGTAIIVTAAIKNGLTVVGKDIKDVKIVVSGAGAAALACLGLLEDMGLKRENIWITDIAGVVYEGRAEVMDEFKAIYAQKTDLRTLEQVIEGADIFLGLSVGGVLKPEYLQKMADKPLIMALANPNPEILPEDALKARPDAIIATGRTDYPNQVNNVLCFPFIFRGALDVGATHINQAMKLACVDALADLAKREVSDIVAQAYPNASNLSFGADYLIPKPFDPRLIMQIAPAVAKAAMESGVATRPIEDLEAYQQSLSQFVFRSGLVMRPVFDQAKAAPKRVIYAEGEEERVLRAAQVAVDEGIARPILVGDQHMIAMRIHQLGLRLKPGQDYDVCDPNHNPNYETHWQMYHELMQRRGVGPMYAEGMVRSRPTVLAALMLKNGEADAMLCGSIGRYHRHLQHVYDVVGRDPAIRNFAALNVLAHKKGTYFIADTYVNPDPSAECLADTAILAAQVVKRFDTKPKIALLSHSNFGSFDNVYSRKMQAALQMIQEKAPGLAVEGEMQAEAALDPKVRERLFPNSSYDGEANLLIAPSLDAANIAFNAIKVLGEAQNIGPILLGPAQPVHIMTPSTSVRGIVNMTAIAVVDANNKTADLSAAHNG